MNGGSLVGFGTSGCIYSPHIPTSKFSSKNKNLVSKVLLHNYADDEAKEQSIIKSIDPSNNFFITYLDLEPLQNLSYSNEKCLADCTSNKNTTLGTISIDIKPNIKKDTCSITYPPNTPHIYNIIYPFAGTELLKVKYTKEQSYINICNLIYSIHLLQKNNLIHQDIKSENILFDGSSMRFIDFGLITNFNDIYNLNKNLILYTNDYPYYPPEHNLFHTIFSSKFIERHKDLHKEEFTVDILLERPKPFIAVIDDGSRNYIELLDEEHDFNLSMLQRIQNVYSKNQIFNNDKELKKRLLSEWVKFVWNVVHGKLNKSDVKLQSSHTIDIWSLCYVLTAIKIDDDNKSRYDNFVQFFKDNCHFDPMLRKKPLELLNLYIKFLLKEKILTIKSKAILETKFSL